MSGIDIAGLESYRQISADQFDVDVADELREGTSSLLKDPIELSVKPCRSATPLMKHVEQVATGGVQVPVSKICWRRVGDLIEREVFVDP